jgi:hypothetical protein
MFWDQLVYKYFTGKDSTEGSHCTIKVLYIDALLSTQPYALLVNE